MLTAALPMARDERRQRAHNFLHWLRTHRGAIAVAGLLAFAAPVTFFTGALSVMSAPTPMDLAELGLWWTLYGIALWCALLMTGYGCERLVCRFGRYLQTGMWFLAACLAAGIANVLTIGRTSILIEHGLVYSARTAQLYAFIFSLIIALLYFAHLRRSRVQEQATARLAAAQAAQRHARRRIVQARLQEVQARIDPQLLFEMLDTLRGLYEHNAEQAESFLDELIIFLRAALPRLRTASSSLLREVELAAAFVRLRGLASAQTLDMTADIDPDAMHARFPPGVLLPLLDTIVGRGDRSCGLAATRSVEDCRVVLTLDATPSDGAVARVQSLLTELYGAAAGVQVEAKAGATHVIVKVPYELA